MPRKTSRPTDPWAAMDALMAADTEPQGAEWFTRLDVQRRYNLTRSAAANRILRWERLGKLETWKGYVAALERRADKYRLKV